MIKPFFNSPRPQPAQNKFTCGFPEIHPYPALFRPVKKTITIPKKILFSHTGSCD